MKYRQIVSERYENYRFFKPGKCTYCGRDSDTIDHVPAMIISYLDHPDVIHMKVPCCRMCNSFLGFRELNTLFERCSFLEKRYETYYSKDLKLPEWEEIEIKQMGPLMRKEIRSALKQKEAIEDVLYHLDLTKHFYSSMMEFNTFSDFIVE